MRRSLVIAAAAVALAGCSQVGSPGQPAASTSTVAVGQPLALSGDGLKATVTVLSVTDHAHATGLIGQPPRNGHYAVADISVKVAAGQYTFDAYYFRYQAANGRTYGWGDGNGTTAGYGPQISAGTLGAGQSTRGFLTFDVPRPAGGDIQLTGPLGAVLGQWKLSR